MRRLERAYSALDTEKTSSGGGVTADAGWRPRRRNTSSPTAADGETSRKHHGERCGRQWAGKQVGADKCRYLSCFYFQCVTKWGWTSWRLPKSGSSPPKEWWYGAEIEAASDVGGRSSGLL